MTVSVSYNEVNKTISSSPCQLTANLQNLTTRYSFGDKSLFWMVKTQCQYSTYGIQTSLCQPLPHTKTPPFTSSALDQQQ